MAADRLPRLLPDRRSLDARLPALARAARLRHRPRHADRLHPPAPPARRGPALAGHHLVRPHAAPAHRPPLGGAARRLPGHREQVPPPHPRPPLPQPRQLRPLRLHADHPARLVLAGAVGRGTAAAPLGARPGLHGRAPGLPQRREPRLPGLVDPAARRAHPLPRPARTGALAPARVGQPAALHLLHDLRPEDHAPRPRRAPGLRRLRRRARLRPAARGVRAQPDHLGAVPLRAARPPSRLVRGDPRVYKGATMRRALLLAFALTAAPRAHAFCGFFVGKADAQLFNKSSQVALVRDGDRTVLTMSNDYQGPLSEFALVVPVPSVLTREQIHIGDRKLLERLDAYSSPRLVEYTDSDPCAPRPRRLFPMAMMERAAGAVSSDAVKEAKAMGVTIEAAYTVGEYDILLLSATQSEGLEAWLRESGYRIPAHASRALAPYIKQDMKFFVAKVNLKEQKKAGFQELRPIQIAYESPRFMLPIRLGMANADGPQDLIIYALTRNGRVESSNYQTVKMPSDAEHFPEDLMFQETGDQQNFQGRYVLNNPFRGEMKCDAREQYLTSVRERRRREATTLAALTGWSAEKIRQRMGPDAPAHVDPWWKTLWK